MRVRVVGAGVAGLTTAQSLVAAGVDVRVVERHQQPGGLLASTTIDGRRFDTGPSLLTWPQVLREVMAATGRRAEDHVDLVQLSPLCRYVFPDDCLVDGPTGPEWNEYVDAIEPMWRAVEVPFLRRPLRVFGNVARLPDLAHIAPFGTLHDFNRRRLRDPRLVRVADRYATYAGADPFRAPATLAVIAWMETRLGGYHVMGGMYRIAQALAHGLDIDLGRRAEPGLSPEVWAAGTPPKRPSLSGVVLLLGVRSIPERLLHHTVVFSDDGEQEFADLAAGRFPHDPTVYVCAPERTDPALAGTMFVMVNAPASGCDENAARANILRRLARAGIEPEIDTEVIRTPAEYGPIYGESSNSPWSAFRRPRVRVAPGWYRAGGGAHPGGGIPLAMLSGMMAADALLTDRACGLIA